MIPATPAIYPVILPVPENKLALKGRDKVEFLSRHARRALAISVGKAGMVLDVFPKDADGVPVSVNGIHWSLSHKSLYVCGVAAWRPVGIDIEKIRPCSEALFDRIAREGEWETAGGKSFDSFFRYWTAKEAVLKATGDGIKGLSRCRVIRIVDDTHLVITYTGREWIIEHLFFNGHIASVTKSGYDPQWTFA